MVVRHGNIAIPFKVDLWGHFPPTASPLPWHPGFAPVAEAGLICPFTAKETRG